MEAWTKIQSISMENTYNFYKKTKRKTTSYNCQKEGMCYCCRDADFLYNISTRVRLHCQTLSYFPSVAYNALSPLLKL